MILITLLIGAILIVAAVRDTYSALFSALGTDIPGFVVWAAAIIALGAIGYVPGLKPVSRGLLILVILVIILRNYQNVLAGLQAVETNSSTAAGSTASTTTSNPASTTAPTASTPSQTTSPTAPGAPATSEQPGVSFAPTNAPVVPPEAGPASAPLALSWPDMGTFASAASLAAGF